MELSQNANLPTSFTKLYWDIDNNRPSENIKKLFALLIPTLVNAPLEDAVKATQAQWLQTMRWEVKSDTDFLLQKKEQIDKIFKALGLTSSFCPKGKFDAALLLGGRANIFIDRCYALQSALEKKDIQLKEIDVLVGAQALHPAEEEILEKSFLHITDVHTEEEMALAVCERMLKTFSIPMNVIKVDLENRRPSTEQTFNAWLLKKERSGTEALTVSDPQFAVYQYLQCMESLYKNKKTDVKLSLMSSQFDDGVFEKLQISKAETQENPILLYLDTIARTLYTIKNRIYSDSNK